MFEFKLFKAIFILVCTYFFLWTSLYWFDKIQVLIANEKKIEWLPRELTEKSAIWGDSLAPNKNIMIIPYGKKELTIYYDTDIYSMSGFWGAKPVVEFSDKKYLKYTIKTVDPVQVENLPSVAANSCKVMPYLKLQLNSDKQMLHKFVKVNTNLVLEYPKITSYNTFDCFTSDVSREFSLFFVSPNEMPIIKKLFKKDLPEGMFVPYIIGFVNIFFFILIIKQLMSIKVMEYRAKPNFK